MQSNATPPPMPDTKTGFSEKSDVLVSSTKYSKQSNE